MTSCCRRDDSVCQASADSILKISGCRRAAKGVVGLHSAAKSGIYNCLVLLLLLLLYYYDDDDDDDDYCVIILLLVFAVTQLVLCSYLILMN